MGGILANFHDVSERREALEREYSLRVEAERAREELTQRSRQLTEANQKLEEADRRKDEFLAMLSHELRSPLAPIRGCIDILKSGSGGAAIQQGTLNMLDRQVSMLTRLVDDLLDVSRITTGRVELQQTDLDLNALVNRVSDSFQADMAQRGHQFTLSLPSTPLWVHGDEIRLDQVVVNVLANAAKFTPPGGHVWLSLTREGDQAVLSFRDTGIGMGSGISSEVFDLLYRGATSTDPATTGGLGVGLALVKSLVEMHGGTVSAHSDGPGHGSEFVVRLPLVEHSASAPGPAEDPERPAASSLRILLVDDHSATREIYSNLLGIFGHQVQTAHDGNSAIEAALGFLPDVVLLDLGLPGMDGYEVARRLRQEPKLQDTVLVAVTGYGRSADRRRSQEAGFQHHLVKPMDSDELEQILSSIAESGTA